MGAAVAPPVPRWFWSTTAMATRSERVPSSARPRLVHAQRTDTDPARRTALAARQTTTLVPAAR